METNWLLVLTTLKETSQLRITEALFAAPNPIPVKAALKIFGLCSEHVRSPLVPLAPESPLYRRLQALAQEIRHDQ